MGGALGACHGLDVPLVFGNLVQGHAAALIGDDLASRAEAETVSAYVRDAWTAFADRGDPGWPAYDAMRRLTRCFDTIPVVAPYPEEASWLLWEDHVFAALPLSAGA